jgi:protein transport protein SEC24
MLWFGAGVSPQIIDDLYGVESMEELDIRMVSCFDPESSGQLINQTRLPKLPTLLSTQVRNILTHLEGIVGHAMPIVVIRQNVDGMEIEFANQLMEDSNNDALGYTDCKLTLPTYYKLTV